ncbi:hypothetical protein [Caldalkalibacillus salinus]|uniref:hypothetical protein n=1 Tax=Caldalkalibacillus salinus TaxID=2803787 RepID=UPI001920D8D4|nr:hypothetical protein [Caldalkalibacillus salinus]
MEKKRNHKSRYRLGIDIDGTITDPATFVPYLNKAFGKALAFEDITQFELPPLYGITEEDFMAWFVENEGPIYEEAALSLYAKEALETLNQDHTLIFISARHQAHHDLTMNWFAKQQLPYDHVELLGSHNKIQRTRDHRIDLFYEDKLDNANQIAEALGIPVILFNTPYNTGTCHTLVHRVSHWKEAVKRTQAILK